MKMGLKKTTMFLIIILIALFHWIMASWWYHFEVLTVVNAYTSDDKEYVKCQYHISKNIRYKIY